MTTFAFINSDGLPTSGGKRPDGRPLPAGAIEMPPEIDPRSVFWDGDKWQARQPLPGWTETAQGVAAEGLPSGAALTAIDAATGEEITAAANAGAASIALPADGEWSVQITAGALWLPFDRTLRRGNGSAVLAAQALVSLREGFRLRVDAAITAARISFLDRIEGREAIQAARLDEARAFIAAIPTPTLANFPMIEAEIGLTAASGYQVAQAFLNAAEIQSRRLAASEKMRSQAHRQITAATGAAAMETILAAVNSKIAAAI